MPERSFGRTIKYRRNKLGLSQAKLGELVGRSAGTIRSWERDSTSPSDTKVITALSAILGVDERLLFDKAGQQLPHVETSPTIEQALASLSPEASGDVETVGLRAVDEPGIEVTPQPAYSAPVATETHVITRPTPRAVEPSYMEDGSQRRLYRVRTLATLVLLLALGIAFVWALTEGLGALGAWWDEFFGSLRL